LHSYPTRRSSDLTDHDENDRIRVAERKITAAHLIEEKKNADGNNDGGAHQPANRATPARAADTVTHRKKPPRNGGRAFCASSKLPRQSEPPAKKTVKSGTRETNQNCAAAARPPRR